MANFGVNPGFNETLGLQQDITGPIPLYQNGFNWLRFWLGCCLTLTLCILLATFITFLCLFCLTVTGAIGNGVNGRMLKPVDAAVASLSNENNNNNNSSEKIPHLQESQLITNVDNKASLVKSFANKMNSIGAKVEYGLEKTEKVIKNIMSSV
jgi:hypothetical protein